MNRSSKGFRVISGILVLLNLVAFFLPISNRIQENYPTLSYKPLDYVKGVFTGKLPFANVASNITATQGMWIILLILLPILLAVITGIWGIIGSYKQKISIVLVFLILALYIIMCTTIGNIWPEPSGGQMYSRGTACTLNLVFSGCAALAAAIALIRTPKKVKVEKNSIPQVREIKQQQVEAKYSVITDEAKQQAGQQEQPAQSVQQSPPAYVKGEPRGVIVGLTGLYAGAEISLTNGEDIKLGRDANNHLIFEGQPKVSRMHCRIRWNAQRKKYSFCDYSSNGSFVNGSSDCLPQNLEMEMEPGTVIAIGDETNTFRLE